MTAIKLTYSAVTPDKWDDFEQLFGERGACGGCWCMLWRLPSGEYNKQKGDGNRKAMKDIILSGRTPGILAYDRTEPVGWCSVAPKEEFDYFSRCRIYPPVDDQKVWSITCLFLHKNYRGKQLSVEIIKVAVDYVKEKGGSIIEGYPFDLGDKTYLPHYVWTGLMPAFEKAGFSEVARHSAKRPIVRYTL